MLLHSMQKKADDAAVNKKVSDDLKEMKRAYDENDPDAIAAIFRNDSIVRDEPEADSL